MSSATPTPNDPHPRLFPDADDRRPRDLYVAISANTIQLIDRAMELIAVARGASAYLDAALEAIDADIDRARARLIAPDAGVVDTADIATARAHHPAGSHYDEPFAYATDHDGNPFDADQ